MQQLLRHPAGVISPTEANPRGHAEAVEVVFDPERLSYRDLLEYFFHVHRSDLGEDLVGSIHRSEIFHTSGDPPENQDHLQRFPDYRRAASRHSRARA